MERPRFGITSARARLSGPKGRPAPSGWASGAMGGRAGCLGGSQGALHCATAPTVTSPPWLRRKAAPPLKEGSGSSSAMWTDLIPAPTSASSHGGVDLPGPRWQGSSVTYAVACSARPCGTVARQAAQARVRRAYRTCALALAHCHEGGRLVRAVLRAARLRNGAHVNTRRLLPPMPPSAPPSSARQRAPPPRHAVHPFAHGSPRPARRRQRRRSRSPPTG